MSNKNLSSSFRRRDYRRNVINIAAPCSVICVPRCARKANHTTRAQINNIPSKSHVIPLLKAHVYPSGFTRLSFCFDQVDLLNAEF